MDVIKKMKPGEPGTKRLLAHYGEQLVCVRYRHDKQHRRRLTTVELIVDAGSYFPDSRLRTQRPQLDKDPKRKVKVKIDYQETELRQQIKQAGGKWDPERKRWLISYREAKQLGLDSRIEEI
jgi:hypothetical protein